MNCKEVRRYLDTALDLELEPSLMIEVEGHLGACRDCGALEFVKRDLKKAIVEIGNIKAPEHLRAKVISAAAGRRRTKKIAVIAAGPLAAAAAVLLVFNFFGRAKMEEPLEAVVGDVVARHTRELPMEVKGTDAATAASWFRGKVDFPVRAPAISLKDASFEGARLSNVRSHQAAYMAYNVDGHRVTLMIFNPESAVFTGAAKVRVRDKEVLVGRQNGFNVVVFFEGDMAYALSSDLPQDRLLSLIKGL